MSRLDYADADVMIPWDFWNTIVSRALGGKRGQQALAEMEAALLALPEKKLISDSLHTEEGVCAVGALLAHKQAQQEGLDMAAALEDMPIHDVDDSDIYETAYAGMGAGMSWSVAWHMAWLNDDKFRNATPAERYDLMLAWVRRAQGKEEA